MKPSLQFRLSQHLTLTPQLQQSIRLLQLSTVELNQEIDRILMDNPALEREDVEDGEAHAPQPAGGAAEPVAAAPAAEAPAADADWSLDLAANWRGTEGEDEGERSFVAPDTPTLRDHLNAQLSVTNLGLREDRGALRDPRRHRAQDAQRLAREPESRRHAAPAHQPAVRRDRRRRAQRRHALGPGAGGALADQERAAALRHHPARVAGDRRAAAPFPRARRGRDAPLGAA